MNHDILRNTFYSTMMTIYKMLYDEYKNEEMAKKNTFKIAKEVLVDFGMRGDLYKTNELLLEQYKQCTDEAKKLELYRKIEVLQDAISIVKEANQVGK